MPQCFTLRRKEEKQLSTFQDIDAELCQHFNVPCDPVHWYNGWYDYIGFSLACGKSFEWLLDVCKQYANEPDVDPQDVTYWERMFEITQYLFGRYTSDAWYEVKH